MQKRTIQKFDEFVNFLFEKMPEGQVPQFIIAKDKQALLWGPGALKPLNPEYMKTCMNRGNTLGICPGAFNSLIKPYKGEDCTVYICAFDIDGYKGEDGLNDTIELLKKNFPFLTLRLSGSGKGLHAFMRLENPVIIRGSINKTKAIKTITEPIVEEMVRMGVDPKSIDKYDYRAFYISSNSGKQKTVYKSDIFYPNEAVIFNTHNTLNTKVKNTQGEIIKIENLDPEIEEIVDFFNKNNILIQPGVTNIRIGDIYPILRDTKWCIESKSKMRNGQSQTNGFINVEQGKLIIYSAPDGKIVLSIESKNNIKRALGLEN